MKIAILTSGILPVPAVQGGAVENLIDFYLEYNDLHHLHDITVYSVWHPDVERHPAQQSRANHYIYIKVDSWWAKLKKRILLLTRGKGYYHYTIEYYLQEAMKHLCQQPYDIIILENRPGYAIRLKDKTTARLVFHLHNDLLNCTTRQAAQIYESAFRIITVSDYIANRVRSINPNCTKTATVHNGIDLQKFSVGEQANKSDSFTLLFSGRVTKEKGIMELIDAMLQLSAYPDIRLLVVGSSFYGNVNNENTFFKTLQDKASTLNDRLTFTGFIPYEQMPRYVQTADVAVIPSVWDDPFPTTVLEAQAMGKPIISTRRGGIPEEVTDQNAILLDTDENFVDNLAAAILDLYEHPEKRKQMAAASLERSKLFDKETYAKNFFAALSNIH